VVTVREQVALSGYTTLRLGGPAARFVAAATDAEIIEAVQAADDRGAPLLVLGGGSNLVVSDDGFPGTVVHIATQGLTARDEAGDCLLTVAAGEDWDALVARCVRDDLAGLECLSGIPGRTGATPIQNVGAYGQEVAETIVSVRAWDRSRGQVTDLARADLGFGYRTSTFKRQVTGATGRFVVLGVRFRLARSPLSGPVRYAELARALGVAAGEPAPLAMVRDAVLALRRRKGMVLDPADPDTRSAGSFFTNPVLTPGQFAALEQAVAARTGTGTGTAIPRYDAPGGQVKVSAAWLIEQAGFGKGYPGAPGDGPRISSKHTLALVNPGGSSTKALLDLAAEITGGVRAAFGVTLVPEPVLAS
jgi:UDP-N-acetylenolpyruvoylglucosamine reductase